MKTSFKLFLKESVKANFENIDSVMDLLDDEFTFSRKDKDSFTYVLNDEHVYNGSLSEDRLKKLQGYFDDSVFISYFPKLDAIQIFKAFKCTIIGKGESIIKLEDHDKFLNDSLKFAKQNHIHITDDSLYCDSEVADKLNRTEEILAVGHGEFDGIVILVASDNATWGAGGHLMPIDDFNRFSLGDDFYLRIDESEPDRIKRFKYLGTK